MIVDDVRPPTPGEKGGTERAPTARPVEGEAVTTVSGVPVSIEPVQVRSALEAIGGIVAQTTLLSALLYFFGYMFVDYLAQGIGLDANTLGYSTRDYVLRSFSPIVPAFGFLLLVGLVVVAIHTKVKGWVDAGRRLSMVDRLALSMAVGGIVLLASAVLAIFHLYEHIAPGFDDWLEANRIVLPLSVLVGIIGMAYGVQVHKVWLSSGEEREALRREPRWLRSLRLAIVFVLVGVNVFWAANEWAAHSGKRAAVGLIRGLSGYPQAIVHSKMDLGIASSGEIELERLADAADGYSFRYEGAKYLTRSAGKYFLLAGSLTEGVRTIVLTDDDSLWVEVVMPPVLRREPARGGAS